jgi:hypothetical protein
MEKLLLQEAVLVPPIHAIGVLRLQLVHYQRVKKREYRIMPFYPAIL